MLIRRLAKSLSDSIFIVSTKKAVLYVLNLNFIISAFLVRTSRTKGVGLYLQVVPRRQPGCLF